MDERRNKSIIGLVFGFDLFLLLLAIIFMVNPNIKGFHGFVEDVSEFIVYLKAVIFISVIIGFNVVLGVLYKFLANSRLMIAMYHACVVSFVIHVLIILAFAVNKPFFGLIMIFLTIFSLYYGYYKTKIDTILAKNNKL